MRVRICPKCGKFRPMTKHSITGNHKPPFKYMCRKCHDEEHDIVQRRKNKKVQTIRPGKWSQKTKKKRNKK